MSTLSLLLVLVSQAPASDVATPDRPGEVMPDRHWDMRHLDLDLRVDPKAGTVEGTATHTVAPLGRPSARLRLHQVDLAIREVRVDGEVAAGWRVGGDTLDIPMPVGGAVHEVAITYAAHPETGLHFRRPPDDRVVEVWSQGEEEDNRHWLPSWDYPNDKFTYSASLTVPADLVALSNGILVDRAPAEAGWTRWRYRLDAGLATYLVALAVGQYAVVADAAGPVALDYVVPAWVDEASARATFGETPDQIAFFSTLLHEPFPWPVYRQVAVQRFLYGAMENTALTIHGDFVLVDMEDEFARFPEEVVAHELAHQWFGDLVTCYGWRELWLNETFAAYYSALWQERRQGPEFFATRVYEWQAHAFEDERPLSPRFFSAREDNAGVLTMYRRGGVLLHGLRSWLGDEVFDAAIARYLDDHAGGLVESDDLRRAFEDASGMHLGWWFDTFVHGTAFPAWTTRWKWADGTLTVEIAQDDGAPAVEMPVPLEIGGIGPSRTHVVWLGGGTTKVEVALEAAPAWVAVDPEGTLLATWTHEQAPEAWVAQLRHSRYPYARLVAMDKLEDGRANDAGAEALAEVLRDGERHPTFRTYAAQALGRLATPDAVAALSTALDTDSPLVRAAAASALGEVPHAGKVSRALEETFRADPHPRVRAAAMQALSQQDAERALFVARKRIVAPQEIDMFELQAAARVLGEHGEEPDLPRLLAVTGGTFRYPARIAALDALVGLLERIDEGKRRERARHKVADRLEALLADADLRMRRRAVQLLANVGDPGSRAALRAMASETTIPGLAEAARAAAARIGTEEPPGPEAPPEPSADEVRERLDTLEERIERLETWRF